MHLDILLVWNARVRKVWKKRLQQIDKVINVDSLSVLSEPNILAHSFDRNHRDGIENIAHSHTDTERANTHITVPECLNFHIQWLCIETGAQNILFCVFICW